MSNCKCEGCDREARYIGAQMCSRHYRNMRVHGTPEAPIRQPATVEQQIANGLTRGLADAVEVGDCLEWRGRYSCKGATPCVQFRDHEKGYVTNASVPRLLWEREHGPIPAGKLIYRTSCNNACMLHLACGTRKDWARARKKAGTSRHSATTRLHMTLAARRRADVTNDIEKAREVRSLAAAKVTVSEIAAVTGVHPTMVKEIRQGRAWRELSASPFTGCQLSLNETA